MTSRIQSAKLSTASGTTLALNIGNSAGNGTVDTTPGSLLIAFVGSLVGARTCSASDNVNGSYSTDAGGTGLSCSVCSFANNAGGPITVTAAISGAATSIALIVEEWSATVTSPALDAHGSASFTAQTSATTPSTGTLAQANELIVAMCAVRANPGAGYSAQGPAFTPDPIGISSPGGTGCLVVGYEVVSSTAAQACPFSWTNSVNGQTAIASYKIAAAPVTVVSQAGGTGSSEDEERRKKRRILALQKNPNPRKASQIFREEMAKLEGILEDARTDREEIEKVATEATSETSESIRDFIATKERKLSRRSIHPGVAVYFQMARAKRSSAIERLQRLARFARYREQVAAEAVRKLKDKIDEDAAVAFMQTMMSEF